MATTVANTSAPATNVTLLFSRIRALLTEPLRVTGTELPENVLLMAKVITLAFIATGQFRLFSWHFLPFVPLFDRMGSPALFHWTLVAIFLAAGAALFFNRRVRLCCLVLGGVLTISLLSSRMYFENNRTYCACILILAGLCAQGQKPWPLRFQVVLVYFGAAMNKLLDQDWRSGQFFAYWFGQIHHPQLWAQMTALIPAMPLAKFFCWTTIITELILVAGFLVPRWYGWAILLGAAYHTALLVVMNSTFGMFYYAMLASYLAFVEWPKPPLVVVYDNQRRSLDSIRRFFVWVDTAGQFTWVPFHSQPAPSDLALKQPQNSLLLLYQGKVLRGFAAFKRLLLWNPLFYFGYVILLGRQPRFFQYHRWVAVFVLAMFTPFLAFAGESAYQWILHRRQQFSGDPMEEERPPACPVSKAMDD